MAVFEREDELRPLRPPRLRTLEERDGRRASYLELFFDLVFVVAIAQLAHELVVDHSLGGFATFAALYLPVFIAWQGFSFYADRFDTDYAWQYSVAIGIWMGSLAFASPARYVLWGAALAWELSIPPLARRLLGAIPLHASHVPERLALFTIIVLGETIVVAALGTSGSEWALSSAVVAALGFVVAAAIWWTYFGGGGEVTLRRSPAAIVVFVYAHIPLLAALTAMSAGISLAIEQSSSSQLDAGARWALAGGAALYLAFVTAAHASSAQGVPARELRARIGARPRARRPRTPRGRARPDGLHGRCGGRSRQRGHPQAVDGTTSAPVELGLNDIRLASAPLA